MKLNTKLLNSISKQLGIVHQTKPIKAEKGTYVYRQDNTTWTYCFNGIGDITKITYADDKIELEVYELDINKLGKIDEYIIDEDFEIGDYSHSGKRSDFIDVFIVADNMADGSYFVKIDSDGYFRAIVPGEEHLVVGQSIKTLSNNLAIICIYNWAMMNVLYKNRKSERHGAKIK